jgi:2,4-dienoyl-CoA reductase-like NADH-dependent reductase (Old Yellow Enzyme family)
MESSLFTPLEIRYINFRNRIAVSPMCEYSSHDGFARDWHPVHLGSRAVGGAALVALAVKERLARMSLGRGSGHYESRRTPS